MANVDLKGLHVAVVGGGISGLCIAWVAAQAGAKVTLYERTQLLRATSSSSTKLLHGGLRYLENGEFRLVKEALQERHWWIKQVPELATPLEIHLPIYRSTRRSRLAYKAGLMLYDWLAGSQNIGSHHYLTRPQFELTNLELRHEQLLGGFSFYDGQMDDYRLGCWVAAQARINGVEIIETTDILTVSPTGRIKYCFAGQQQERDFDRVINAAGPWAEQLLKQSGISSKYQLDHVRGSHLLLNRSCEHGYFLEIPFDRRIFFVLPYNGQSLIGTTEQRQLLHEPIECSEEEGDYLINAYNHYFKSSISLADVSTFSGLRPLIHSSEDPSKATREYAIQIDGRLRTVFGGKWTTSRALAAKVVRSLTDTRKV